MSIPPPDREGLLDWRPQASPDVEVHTWYRINGRLDTKATPIIFCHGGPGIPHDYMLNLTKLLATGHPIIFYDQLGCGNSTRLPDTRYKGLWVQETFIEELRALIDHLHLNNVILGGHSYGGYLVQQFAIRYPGLIRGLVIISGLQDMSEVTMALQQRVQELPEELRDAIREADRSRDYNGSKYIEAIQNDVPKLIFYQKFMFDYLAVPDFVKASIHKLKADPHVYETMWGPSEFAVTGTIRNDSIASLAHNIQCSVLLCYGTHDELALCQEAMIQRLSGAKTMQSIVFEGARHFAHIDAETRLLGIVERWLRDQKNGDGE